MTSGQTFTFTLPTSSYYKLLPLSPLSTNPEQVPGELVASLQCSQADLPPEPSPERYMYPPEVRDPLSLLLSKLNP